jgi:HSP20 family molecular chaperone IbpA
VEIAVEIPEHSKQDIQLTINGKDAIVSFNRRYSDANKVEDGTINKISKVETFTSRLPTQHFLDAKSVKGTYENGVMNYVIKKA